MRNQAIHVAMNRRALAAQVCRRIIGVTRSLLTGLDRPTRARARALYER